MLKIDIATIRSLLALDAEFDEVVSELVESHGKMQESDSYEDIALYALQASKLEKRAQQIFNQALEVLND
jgi:hypothetical protein